MTKVYKCDLDCCFAMWRWHGSPDFLTDIPPREDDFGEPEGFKVCDADKQEWERETSNPQYGDEDGYIGGVPMDCPIYQGEAEPPWEQSSKGVK